MDHSESVDVWRALRLAARMVAVRDRKSALAEAFGDVGAGHAPDAFEAADVTGESL